MHSDPQTESAPAADGDVVGRRIAAALVDIVLLVVLAYVISAIFGQTTDGGFELSGGSFLLFLVLMALYFILLEGTYGQTLGKMLLGLRVTSDDGTRADTGAVVLRNLLRLIDGLPLLYLVGFVVMMATPRRQRIGDLVGKTVVGRA